jgi:hypothetical protein
MPGAYWHEQPNAVARGRDSVTVPPLVGPFREFDPKIELPRWLDEYKWHRDDSRWNQCGRDWTTHDLREPHYPQVWRTRRPNSVMCFKEPEVTP